MRAPFPMALSCVSWLRANHACQIDSCMLGGGLSVTNARHRMATTILPAVMDLTEAVTTINSIEPHPGGGRTDTCWFCLVLDTKFFML